MSITQFTILILCIYLVGIKFVSYFAYKLSSRNAEDYFLAKRDVPLFALVATTMASIFSTGTVVSAPSEFFTKGTGYFWIFSFSLLPLAMMPVVIKFWKLGKERGYTTPGELLGDLYGSRRIQIITAIIGLLSVMPYAAAQMVAVGKTFEALTDGVINYSLGVTIVAFAIGLYLFYGGSRAVIWTDVVQGVIFSTLLVVTGFLTLHWAGGWSNMVGNLSTSAPEKVTFAVDLHYFEYFPLCITFFLLPYVWQRMYMARSASTVAKNVTVLPFVFTFLFLITWVIGSSAVTLFPEGLTDGDSVLGAIFRDNAPYFGALVLVAAFAAGMSTVDSQLLSAGSILTEDIRPLWLSGNQDKDSDSSEFDFARWSTIVLLIIIYLWSLTLQSKSVLSLIILGISLTVILAPSVYGLFYWKSSTEKSAFWSLSIGLIVFLVKEFSSLGEFFPGPFGASSWAFAVSLLVFVAIALFQSRQRGSSLAF